MNHTSKEQIEFLNDTIADGGFLQSEEWRNFQESTGKKVYHIESFGYQANVIEHVLTGVGKYWYIPRGPVVGRETLASKETKGFLQSIVDRALQNNINWIRMDLQYQETLSILRGVSGFSIKKAPHDMQPKEVFVADITASEEELLSRMKSKTRYNIRLAEKKGVEVFVSRDQEHLDAFCDLIEITAKRDGIISHPREHYQNMFRIIPENMLKLYVARYKGKIIAANIVIFFGRYATYLHGASGNDYREVMAPYILQWRQIQDAKVFGCTKYDFGGVKIVRDGKSLKNSWAGITRFKQGFAPHQLSTEFFGSYDLILNEKYYTLYSWIRRVKKLIRRFI